MMKNSQCRLVWADSLKGWLMVLVVLGHSIQYVIADECYSNHIWNLIYSFHMPAFMAISGWLSFKNKSISTNVSLYIKKRFCQLLIPYSTWTFLAILISFSYSINYFNIILRPDCYFWFLWVLFWICCIFEIIKTISLALQLDEIYLIIIISLFLLTLMSISNLRLFGFQYIAYYFLFYSFGYFVNRYKFLNITNHFLLSALFAIWVALAWNWDMHSLPSFIPQISIIPSSLLQYTYRGITAIVALIFLFGIRYIFDKNNGINNFVIRIGNVSLGIYTCHILIMRIVPIPQFYSAFGKWTFIIILFVFGLFTSYAVINVLKRNSISASIFLGKF